MALAAIVDTLDTIPEAQRSWYVEKDGKFNLDISKIEFEDTSSLKTALEKERNAVKEAKIASKKALEDAMLPFAGIDPVKTRALLSKFDNEEEAALIAAGKVDEVIAKRMAKRDAEQQRLLDAAEARAKDALEVANTFMGRVLDNNIRAAASKAGIHTFAIEDALLRARMLFSLDNNGEAVQFHEDGESVVLGKDGKTPFGPSEWLETMKESAPHWFPAGSSGGGAGGSGGAGAGGKTITRAAFDALPISEKPKAARTLTIVD